MQQNLNPDDFNYKNVILWLHECTDYYNKQKDIPILPLSQFLEEFCKIFKKMSMLLGIAFSDVKEKVEIMRQRQDEYKTQGVIGLFAIIQLEKEKNILEWNGENNDSLPKNSPYKKYISEARTVLRMMRFMNYLKIMFNEILVNKTCKISDACSKAYMEALYPYHTFLVQTAAKAAMMAAPNRDKILPLFAGPNSTEDLAYTALNEFLTAHEPVRLLLWDYYDKNGLSNLP